MKAKVFMVRHNTSKNNFTCSWCSVELPKLKHMGHKLIIVNKCRYIRAPKFSFAQYIGYSLAISVKKYTMANFSILNQNIQCCQISGISSHNSKFFMVQLVLNLYSAYQQNLGLRRKDYHVSHVPYQSTMNQKMESTLIKKNKD